MPHILTDAAGMGDKVAKDIYKAVGKNLGIFLSILINFANPDTIVLCGGVSRAEKYFMKYMSIEIKKRVFKSAFKSCRIVISKYMHRLGVVGAAMLPKQ
jgi:glucokinase